MKPSIQLLLAFSAFAVVDAVDDWLSPPYKWLFQFPLPIPPVKDFSKVVTSPVTGKDIRYYQIEIKEFKSQVYPDRGPATLWGYDGMSPGPTLVQERGVESVVRFVNNARLPNSVHLHGSYSRAPFDGWAEDTTPPGCQNARTLWYHDHAIDHTAENAYFGQAGAYILHDGAEDALNLPSGQYDIPLILTAKQYNSDGSLFSPANEQTSLYGDVIHVNGQPWPHFRVEPRRYRFRFLDASISRTFFLYFERDTKQGTKLEFNVISSDAGLLSGAQKVKDLYISMAERYEIVMDFSNYKGENVTLRNARDVGADKDYPETDKVMKFIVSDDSVNDPSSVPSSLRAIPYPPDTGKVDRHFRFERQSGNWVINGVTFADVKNRVLAKPNRGTIETWELENSSGGWSHPIHIHLIDFKVVKRTGSRSVMPYEAAGLKDVIWLGPGETVTVAAYYAPWDGVYMFHCHNLIHEDHEMMAAFNVSVLADFGYDETHYIDPMEARWRAKQQSPAAFDDSAIESRIKEMAGYSPYDKVDEVNAKLQSYWATHTGPVNPPPASTTTPKTSTTSSTIVTSTTSKAASSTTTAKTTSTTKTTKTSTTKTSTTKAATTTSNSGSSKKQKVEKEEKEEKEKEKDKRRSGGPSYRRRLADLLGLHFEFECFELLLIFSFAYDFHAHFFHGYELLSLR
ncbi:bilirubin oxidase [Diplogelasinospora grovesii]|uniref:Bilirubin oxidase n=1 Tax=Diplogelasinospora grovesii TaxID=303347 RepID=A0AAN6N258_9PEZI|nr:bilirubin oxidase [Diplogelasinospora grovesii]